jgi:hypothetical protein
MADVEGVDYSWARPSPTRLAAAGKRFACRYLSNSTSGKNLSRDEAEALSRAGLAVVANWEWVAGDARGGYQAGVNYAREAHRQAVACGMPDSRPIYFSVDYDATTSELNSTVDAYLRGVASVIGTGRVGVYGGYRTIEWASRTGRAAWLWQTYAWSAGRWHPAAHIQQYSNGITVAGAQVDLNRARTADYGQWTVGVPRDGDDLEGTWTQPLTQGAPGYAGQQRDTALAFTWKAANEAAAGMTELLTAADQAEERDKAIQTAIEALSPAGSATAAPVLAAINAVRDDSLARFDELMTASIAANARAAAAESEVTRLRAELAPDV